VVGRAAEVKDEIAVMGQGLNICPSTGRAAQAQGDNGNQCVTTVTLSLRGPACRRAQELSLNRSMHSGPFRMQTGINRNRP